MSRLTSSRWVPLQSAHTIDWTCHPPRIFRLFLNHDCEPRFARDTFAFSRVVQKNDAQNAHRIFVTHAQHAYALSCSKRLVFGFLCGASGFPWLSRDFPGWISRSRERSLSETVGGTSTSIRRAQLLRTCRVDRTTSAAQKKEFLQRIIVDYSLRLSEENITVCEAAVRLGPLIFASFPICVFRFSKPLEAFRRHHFPYSYSTFRSLFPPSSRQGVN